MDRADSTSSASLPVNEGRRAAVVDAFLSLTSDGILVVERDQRIRFANPAAGHMLAVEPQDLVGVDVLDVVRPDHRPALFDFLAQDLSRTSARLPVALQRRDGAHCSVEVSGVDLLDQPESQGVVLVIRQIRSPSEAQVETERGERRLRKILSHSSDTVGLADEQGVIQWVTGAGGAILGRSGLEWRGQRVFEVVHPDDQPVAHTLLERALAEPGHPHRGHVRVRHADGHWVDLDVTVVNLFDDPDVGAAVLTSRNVSRYMEMERALRAAHDQAVDVLAAKADFVSQVGHEVRTPIHSILGLAELLADRLSRGGTEPDPEALRMVSTISRAAEGMSRVVEDLLLVSTAEAGRLELHDEPFSLHRLVVEVVDLMRPAGVARGIGIDGSVDELVPAFVRGDEQRLRQVLLNLVGNGVKFTHEGSVTLEVRTVSRDTGSCALEFVVTDTGVGIPADELAHLFTPFAQASSAAASGHEGTGLGLAIAQQLAELMGGSVRVRSEVGRGSTFTFSVSLLLAGPDAAQQLSARGSMAELPQLGAKVLVVEDSPVIRAVLERQLRRLGCDVLVATSVREASALLGELSVDLVILDGQLGDEDGLELLRERFEADAPRAVAVPTVVLTGDASELARVRALDAGAVQVLVKPVTTEGLARALIAVFEDSSAGRPLAAPGASTESVPVQLVDPVALATLAEEMGDRDFAGDVVRTYLEELEGRLVVLRSAAVVGGVHGGAEARGDVARIAHTLTSTSRVLGAHPLADACQAFEHAATDGRASLASHATEVLILAARTAAALQAWLDDIPAQRSRPGQWLSGSWPSIR